MRIGLLLTEYPQPAGHGGMAAYLHTLSNALAEAGHSVLLAHKDGLTPGPLHSRVSTHVLKPFPGRIPRRLLIGRVDRAIAHQESWSEAARRFFDRHNPDIVQIPEYNGEAVRFSRTRYPVIVRFHTPAWLVDRLNRKPVTLRRRLWHRFERIAFSRAHTFTTSSRGLKERVCAHDGVAPERITVLRNPVDTDTFCPSPVHSQARRHPVLLFCGRLERRKGIHILAHALPALLDTLPTMTIRFSGMTDDPEERRWKSKLTERAGRHAGRLEFLPAMDRARLPEIYRSSDVFIAPAPFDNSPNTLFEAMACGTAVVGSDTGGINEIIDHENTGLLFPIHRIEMLVREIGRLIREPDLRHRLGRQARDTIVRNHAPPAIAGKTAAFYRTVIRQCLSKETG